jgi:type IV fimbrial biogenesis protein FimT
MLAVSADSAVRPRRRLGCDRRRAWPAMVCSPWYSTCGRRRQRAFTLVELLIVMAIAAVLLGVALPAIDGMLRAYRLRLAAAELFGAVELARAQAIALGQKVTLAPSAATLDWADGWTVFIDRNGNRRPDGGDDILMRHPALAHASSAQEKAEIAVSLNFGVQQGPPYLAYNSMGRGCSHLSSLTPRFGTLTLAQGRQIRRIKINMLGRARLCDPGRDAAVCAGADP